MQRKHHRTTHRKRPVVHHKVAKRRTPVPRREAENRGFDTYDLISFGYDLQSHTDDVPETADRARVVSDGPDTVDVYSPS